MSDESKTAKKTLLSHEHIAKLVKEAFPQPNTMCPFLCEELQNLSDLYEDAPPKQRPAILARIHAVSMQLQQLHCKCTLQ